MRPEAVQDPILKSITLVAQPFGIALIGIADYHEYARRFPESIHDVPDRFPRAVVMAQPLSRGALSTVVDRPTHLYFHHYREVNRNLDRAALAVAEAIEGHGALALPVAASQTLDKYDLVAHLSHRHLAWLAGMGWHGKDNLLVTHQFGSAVRLVTVLTDAVLPVGSPLAGDPCEGCDVCARACPAAAIGDRREDFDLQACHDQLSEFRKIPRIGQRICGVCQKVCPAGRGQLPKDWPVVELDFLSH